MISYIDDHTNKQYVFGNFVLYASGSLLHQEQQIHVPPKELAVLTLLLNAQGELVSKDTILDHVWPDNDVNEESLTRCIYALRRVLMENKHCRYIDTIYGKGYRFTRNVVTVSLPRSQVPHTSIAVLPFHTHQQLNAVNLHHGIIQTLAQFSPFGLTVLPAAITKHCHDLSSITALIEQLNPGYYLAGQTMPMGNSWQLRVELVRSTGHQLIHHESFVLSGEQPLSALQNRIAAVLPSRISEVQWNPKQTNSFNSLDSAMLYLHAQHELKRHTPSSLRLALSLLHQCVSISPEQAPLYCSLAECYLTMSQLGLFDQQHSLTNARQAVNKAIELAPSHPHALGLLALISGIYSEHTIAMALFEQARFLAPNSATLDYYYAWSLFLSGDLMQAKQFLHECLTRDPTHIAASALNVWLTYYTSSLDEAITLGWHQLLQHGQEHPVLQSIQALLLALQKKQAQAEELIQMIHASGENSGLIAVNLCYAHYSLHGDAALPLLQTFLNNVDNRHIRASLLPLINIVHGKNAALDFWRKLEHDDYHWIKVWRHDPRLKELAKEIECQYPEVS